MKRHPKPEYAMTPRVTNPMSFTVSLDDFIISYFTGGTTQVLSTLIYSMTKKVVNPEINAISTILLLIVFL